MEGLEQLANGSYEYITYGLDIKVLEPVAKTAPPIDCDTLIFSNLEKFSDRFHNLALWLGLLVAAAVVMTYLNRGEIRFLGHHAYTIPSRFTLSDTRYIEYMGYLNVGFIGVAVFLLFPLY